MRGKPQAPVNPFSLRDQAVMQDSVNMQRQLQNKYGEFEPNNPYITKIPANAVLYPNAGGSILGDIDRLERDLDAYDKTDTFAAAKKK
jgi:hypothetical protein